MRQIILDTETTGLETSNGHRIIEIGCVEMINRRLTGNNYHKYLQPDRQIDEGAIAVHGITNESLAGKPRFAEIAKEFIDYLRGAELVIHNAPFDIGFINYELSLLGPEWGRITDSCRVLDTLAMARKMHPGQRNTLDALCKRYDIDNGHRQWHGALLDAEILGDVYLAMTGGQTALSLGTQQESTSQGVADNSIRRVSSDRPRLKVISANDEEQAAHAARLAAINKASGGSCLWMQQESLSTGD